MTEDSCCHGGSCQPEPGETAANGVANPGVLDALAEDKLTGEVVLIMFEPRPWTLGDQQLFQLQEKLNSYVSFALDGEMAEQLPQLANRPLRVQLNCAEPPPAHVVEFLAKVREQVSFQGINFVVEGLAPPAEGGCGEGCGCSH
jgi:hypothetical protein